MEKTKKTSFVAGAAILAFAGVLCKIIGVLIRIWAYDIIGEAGMVYYEVVFPFYSWLLIISSSGIPTAISRMVSERLSTGDFADIDDVRLLADLDDVEADAVRPALRP